MARLTMQNEELKELVANCERTIVQKDSIIANLTTTLNKQKSKEGLVRSFHSWKLRHCDEKREVTLCLMMCTISIKLVGSNGRVLRKLMIF